MSKKYFHKQKKITNTQRKSVLCVMELKEAQCLGSITLQVGRLLAVEEKIQGAVESPQV